MTANAPTPVTFLKAGDPCALSAQVLAVDSLGRRFRLSDVVEVDTVSGRVVDLRGGVVFRRVEIDLSRCSPDEIAEQRRWQEARSAGREPVERVLKSPVMMYLGAMFIDDHDGREIGRSEIPARDIPDDVADLIGAFVVVRAGDDEFTAQVSGATRTPSSLVVRLAFIDGAPSNAVLPVDSVSIDYESARD